MSQSKILVKLFALTETSFVLIIKLLIKLSSKKRNIRKLNKKTPYRRFFFLNNI